MANPNVLFGFQPVGLIDGTSPTFGLKTVQLAANNAHSIYQGDVAAAISGGYYDVATEVGGGAAIGGVFWSFSWLSKSQGRVRGRAWLGLTGDLVAGTVIEAKVIIDRDALFRVRSAGTGGAAVGQTNIGQNCNFTVGAGPGNNLVSTFGLDDVTLGSGASLPFTVYDLEQQPDTDPTSLYNIVTVRFNNLTLP